MNQANTPIVQRYSPFDFHMSQGAAKRFLETHPATHYPIVEKGVFIGNALTEDIFTLESDQTLEDLRHQLELFSTTIEANWFDILEICSKNDTNLVPLIDDEKRYIGYYHFNDLITFFAEIPFFSEKAVTLTIEKNSQKFSFSEITHLVESNNAALLGVFISKIANNVTEITLKINSENINEVIQSLRRHDYEILSKHLEDNYTHELQERSNYLNKYLNI